jgi:hypothetical protein
LILYYNFQMTCDQIHGLMTEKGFERLPVDEEIDVLPLSNEEGNDEF